MRLGTGSVSLKPVRITWEHHLLQRNYPSCGPPTPLSCKSLTCTCGQLTSEAFQSWITGARKFSQFEKGYQNLGQDTTYASGHKPTIYISVADSASEVWITGSCEFPGRRPLGELPRSTHAYC